MSYLDAESSDGWTNRETMYVARWLTNDGFQVSEELEDVEELSNEIQNFVGNLVDEMGSESGIIRDLLEYSIAKVNWLEIAEQLMN